MSRSRMDRWATRWARWASRVSGLKFTIWLLLGWGVAFMIVATRSSTSGGVIFMTGLMLIMAAWYQFERLGFIRLLEETRDGNGRGAETTESRSEDRSHTSV